jgi:tetratricopeptide (TPR) repeat protein
MRPSANLITATGILLAASVGLAAPSEDSGTAARAEFARGMAALRDGRIDVARQAFSETVALAPAWGLAYLQWGIVELSVDADAGVARECLETAVELSPQNARAHFHLGELYEKVGQSEAAIREYRTALALRSSMREAAFKLAAALAATGARLEAISVYESIVAKEPEHTGALAALAELYEQTERLEEAEKALVAITMNQPGVAYNHYRLGQFYERIGKERKARKAFSRANSLDPRPQRKMRRLR